VINLRYWFVVYEFYLLNYRHIDNITISSKCDFFPIRRTTIYLEDKIKKEKNCQTNVIITRFEEISKETYEEFYQKY